MLAKAKAFVIGELLKDERIEAKLTQEELANKIGAKTDRKVTSLSTDMHFIFRHWRTQYSCARVSTGMPSCRLRL